MIDIGQLLQAWALVVDWLVVLTVIAGIDQWMTARNHAEDDQ